MMDLISTATLFSSSIMISHIFYVVAPRSDLTTEIQPKEARRQQWTPRRRSRVGLTSRSSSRLPAVAIGVASGPQAPRGSERMRALLELQNRSDQPRGGSEGVISGG